MADRRKYTRRKVLGGTAGAAALAFLARCAPTTTGGTPSPTASAGSDAIQGGQIVFNSATEPSFLTILLNGGSTPHYYTRFFRNALVRPDKNMEMAPDLAESWTVSADRKVYTFKLRKDVKWHDGKPFTSADCMAFYSAVLHPKTAPRNTGLSITFSEIAGAKEFTAGTAPTLKGINAPDPYTFEVTLGRAYSPFLALVAAECIEPKHVLDSVTPDLYAKTDAILRQPVGTGPFKFVEWKASEYIKMSANTEYFRGRPNVDTLIARFAPDLTTYPSLLRSGTVDVIGLGDTMGVDDVQTFEGDANFRIEPRDGVNSHVLSFNVADPFLSDVRVRRALSWAFDREAFVKAFYKGRAVINDTPIPNSNWAYTEPSTKPKFDVAGAKALLAQAGWAPGADGILVKDGKRFALEMITVDTIQQSWPVAVQRAWKEVGVDLRLTALTFSALFTRYAAKNFQTAALWQTIGRYLDPAYIFPQIALNGPGYKDPEADRLIAEASESSEPAVRKDRMAKATEIFNRDVPYFFVVYPRNDWVTGKKVRLAGYKSSVLEYFNAAEWTRLK